MPYINVEVEDDVRITVKEFFDAMDEFDKNEMRRLLKMEVEMETSDYSGFDYQAYKLIGNSWRLTREDEETILKITDKIC